MRIAVRALEWIGVGVLVGLLILIARPTAHALPEYAARTGQPCAVCHVNPAGGGPRTERGALWVAQGKPDEVPALPTAEGEQASAAEPGPVPGTRPLPPAQPGCQGENEGTRRLDCGGN